MHREDGDSMTIRVAPKDICFAKRRHWGFWGSPGAARPGALLQSPTTVLATERKLGSLRRREVASLYRSGSDEQRQRAQGRHALAAHHPCQSAPAATCSDGIELAHKREPGERNVNRSDALVCKRPISATQPSHLERLFLPQTGLSADKSSRLGGALGAREKDRQHPVSAALSRSAR